jgi:hypothetical protein
VIALSRSLTAAGTALMGASLIATSASAPVSVAVPPLSDAAISLQASVLDIFTFPAAQQAIVNEVEYAALWAAGLALSGIGVSQSLAAVLPTLITATQQIFARDPLGALTTVEDAAVGAAEAILVPLVASRIDIGQIQLAVESALLLARPVAAVELGAGLFAALDAVTRAVITAGQNFVNAVLSLNLGNIVAATVDGVRDVVTSFGTAGQDAVDGIVAAQSTLALALAERPVPIPVAAVARSASAAAPSVPSARATGAAAAAETAAAAEAAPAAGVTTTVVADVVATELGEAARESAAPGASTADSTPRRAAARTTRSDSVAVADAGSTTRTGSTPKRSARGAAAS